MSDTPPNKDDLPMVSPLLTAKQAAEYLSISVSVLNKHRRMNLIKATYVCSDARYHRDDIDAYIELCRQGEGRKAS